MTALVSAESGRGARRPRRLARWVLARILFLVLAAYLGLIVLLLAFENALIYHPVTAAEEWLAPPSRDVQDVELHSADGTRIHAWWCPVKGATSAALHCHGNAGNLSHRGASIVEWQRARHESILIFDYPGYGRSGGRPSEAGCNAAAAAAYEWLTKKQGIEPRRVTLHGVSLGCAVAVELGRAVRYRALVLVSPFTSIPDMAQEIYPWLPARWLVRHRFDSLTKIGQCPGPVFIAHGDCDRIVPYSQGRRLFEAAREPKEFCCLTGLDHNDLPGADFYQSLDSFLAQVETSADRSASR